MQQIVKYKWDLAENGPSLILKEKNGLDSIMLFEKDIAFRTGERRCIGFFCGGRHFECPDNRIVDGDYCCNECRIRDDFSMCIRCDGSFCSNEKNRRECERNNYFVYLAAFDSLLKVGISFERRLQERLVEQGADFGAKVALIRDGQRVRLLEQQIRKTLGIADRVRGKDKRSKLFGNPNVSASAIYKSIILLRKNFSEFMVPPEIYDLRKYYNLQNVLSNPEHIDIKEGTELKGRVVAAKGNIMVMQNSNGFFSVNAHDMIGREVESV